MRKTIKLALVLAIAGVGLSACYHDRPGYPSDHHHGHHDHDHDHDHDH
jgi:hypothetical protein